MMKWIQDYQLFLFDFDGLLVNTEEIHFLAYQTMCAGRGFELSWSFTEYCMAAHYDATKLRKQVYQDLPGLYKMEPDWDVLYAEKKAAMVKLLQQGAVHLMPGAESLLRALAESNIARCVVTHSPDEQIALIKKVNPILESIPHWYTRETYSHPKPHPECYLNAIHDLGNGGEIIGFEDSPRGLRALLQTPAQPILVSEVAYPEIPEFVEEGVKHYSSLLEVL